MLQSSALRTTAAAVALAATLAACTGLPVRDVGPDGLIPEGEELVLIDDGVFHVEMMKPDALRGPRVRSFFLARPRGDTPPIERLIVEVWSDLDGDGVRGPGEPWTRVDVHEPEGRPALVAALQAWHRPGAPVAFALEVRAADLVRTHAGRFTF
jgi:hypothetical protein